MWLFVPESPKFLLEQGRKEQFISSLQKIAKINGLDAKNLAVNFEEVRGFGGSEMSSQKKPQNFGTINGDGANDEITQ
jgi:hypothetical protein